MGQLINSTIIKCYEVNRAQQIERQLVGFETTV